MRHASAISSTCLGCRPLAISTVAHKLHLSIMAQNRHFPSCSHCQPLHNLKTTRYLYLIHSTPISRHAEVPHALHAPSMSLPTLSPPYLRLVATLASLPSLLHSIILSPCSSSPTSVLNLLQNYAVCQTSLTITNLLTESLPINNPFFSQFLSLSCLVPVRPNLTLREQQIMATCQTSDNVMLTSHEHH